jgi:hypothetical protein
MISFAHTGPEWPSARCLRNTLISIFLAAGAVLLFPFVLLALFLKGLWYVARPLSR